MKDSLNQVFNSFGLGIHVSSFVCHYRLDHVPQNLHGDVLTPRTSECDLVWRQGLCRGDQVKMRVLGVSGPM